MLIKRLIFHVSDETEIRLPFYGSFSTFWNIFGGLYTQVFYSWHSKVTKSHLCCEIKKHKTTTQL